MESLGALQRGQVQEHGPDDDGDCLSEPETTVNAEVEVANRAVAHSAVGTAVFAGKKVDLKPGAKLEPKIRHTSNHRTVDSKLASRQRP